MEEYLGRIVEVVVDRPLGTRHPVHRFFYPINYGYIPGTISGDNEEIDVYIIGEFEPLEKYTGSVIAVIKRTNDNEDKLVVCKEIGKYNKFQVQALVEFQERFFI